MKALKRILLITIISLIVWVYVSHSGLDSLFYELQTMTGIKALLMFSLVYLTSNLLLLPLGLPLNLLAGLLWGTVLGGLLINGLATLVAGLAFLLARFIGASFFAEQVSRYTILRRFKDTINRYDWQFIFTIRINPIIPFCLSNYLFGLLPGLSFRHYITATVAANLLPSFAFASIGAIFKTVSLTNTNINYWIINLGVALLLITGVWLIKKTIKRNSNENNIMCTDPK